MPYHHLLRRSPALLWPTTCKLTHYYLDFWETLTPYSVVDVVRLSTCPCRHVELLTQIRSHISALCPSYLYLSTTCPVPLVVIDYHLFFSPHHLRRSSPSVASSSITQTRLHQAASSPDWCSSGREERACLAAVTKVPSCPSDIMLKHMISGGAARARAGRAMAIRPTANALMKRWQHKREHHPDGSPSIYFPVIHLNAVVFLLGRRECIEKIHGDIVAPA